VAKTPAGSLARRLGDAFCPGQADQDSAAEQTEEVAPVRIELVERLLEQFVPLRPVFRGRGERPLSGLRTHRPPPFNSLAAWWMAWTMRKYVPQRQTFPSMARTISWVVGVGFLPSRATPAMIMPQVQ